MKTILLYNFSIICSCMGVIISQIHFFFLYPFNLWHFYLSLHMQMWDLSLHNFNVFYVILSPYHNPHDKKFYIISINFCYFSKNVYIYLCITYLINVFRYFDLNRFDAAYLAFAILYNGVGQHPIVVFSSSRHKIKYDKIK